MQAKNMSKERKMWILTQSEHFAEEKRADDPIEIVW